MPDEHCTQFNPTTSDAAGAHHAVDQYSKLAQPERWKDLPDSSKSKIIGELSFALAKESIDGGVPSCHVIEHIKKLSPVVRDEVISYLSQNAIDLLEKNDPEGAKLMLNVLWGVKASSDSAALSKNLAQFTYFSHPTALDPNLVLEKAKYTAEYALKLASDPETLLKTKEMQEQGIGIRIGKVLDVGYALLENPELANAIRKRSFELFGKINQQKQPLPTSQDSAGTVVVYRGVYTGAQLQSQDPTDSLFYYFQRGLMEFKFAQSLKLENIQNIISAEFSTDLSIDRNSKSENAQAVRQLFPKGLPRDMAELSNEQIIMLSFVGSTFVHLALNPTAKVYPTTSIFEYATILAPGAKNARMTSQLLEQYVAGEVAPEARAKLLDQAQALSAISDAANRKYLQVRTAMQANNVLAQHPRSKVAVMLDGPTTLNEEILSQTKTNKNLKNPSIREVSLNELGKHSETLRAELFTNEQDPKKQMEMLVPGSKMPLITFRYARSEEVKERLLDFMSAGESIETKYKAERLIEMMLMYGYSGESKERDSMKAKLLQRYKNGKAPFASIYQ